MMNKRPDVVAVLSMSQTIQLLIKTGLADCDHYVYGMYDDPLAKRVYKKEDSLKTIDPAVERVNVYELFC